MTLGNRLREARKRKGYTQKQLAQRISAKHNSVSNWENGLNMPDTVTIEAICSILEITPNYLLMGGEFEVRMAAKDGFTSGEAALIKKYRRLDKDAQGAVEALIGYYCGIAPTAAEGPSADVGRDTVPPAVLHVHRSPEFKVLPGMMSTQSVAAGTGTYLDPDAFEPVSVVENELTRRADFYVPVSGNSMEPKFCDGDILIIENMPVRRNEIGIFTLDGHGFVKIRGESELISINPAYAPIPMNDDIVCNGKVIGILEREWLVD